MISSFIIYFYDFISCDKLCNHDQIPYHPLFLYKKKKRKFKKKYKSLKYI